MSNKYNQEEIDKYINKLSKKTNVNIKKANYSFEGKLKKVNNEYVNAYQNRLDDINKKEKLIYDFLILNQSDNILKRYKYRLNKLK